MDGLVLHCGAQAVEPLELDNVALPPIKRNDQGHVTFQPVSHYTLRNRLRDALGQAGSEVIEESQGMTNDGQRAFGMMEVRPAGSTPLADAKRGLMVGWRSSHDQSFAAAVAMGSRVFNCDNLAWSGEIQVSRRHTRHIVRDLPEIISRAVGQLLQASHRQEAAFLRMETYGIGRVAVNDTLVEAMKAQAITNASIPKVLKEYESDSHREMHGADNAWSLFNAFTEIGKADPVTTAMKRTQRLHGVFGKLVGVSI
jgi:hypothetical protein